MAGAHGVVKAGSRLRHELNVSAVMGRGHLCAYCQSRCGLAEHAAMSWNWAASNIRIHPSLPTQSPSEAAPQREVAPGKCGKSTAKVWGRWLMQSLFRAFNSFLFGMDATACSATFEAHENPSGRDSNASRHDLCTPTLTQLELPEFGVPVQHTCCLAGPRIGKPLRCP